MTNRNVLIVIWLLALSFWQPSKAQALPILLTIQSTHMSFDHGSYDNAGLSGLGSRGFAGNWMGLIPWGGGIGLFGTGGSGGGGFPGSGGAGGFAGFGGAGGSAGSGGAGGFARSGGAGGFPGSGGGFPGIGAGPNVAFAVITLWSLEHPSGWFHHDFHLSPILVSLLEHDRIDRIDGTPPKGSRTCLRLALRGRGVPGLAISDSTTANVESWIALMPGAIRYWR